MAGCLGTGPRALVKHSSAKGADLVEHHGTGLGALAEHSSTRGAGSVECPSARCTFSSVAIDLARMATPRSWVAIRASHNGI